MLDNVINVVWHFGI